MRTKFFKNPTPAPSTAAPWSKRQTATKPLPVSESATASLPRTRQAGYKPVTARYGNPYQETVYIEVSDGLGKIQILVSNRIHPFYSDGKWIKAEDLKTGSRLFAENGVEPTVQSVTTAASLQPDRRRLAYLLRHGRQSGNGRGLGS